MTGRDSPLAQALIGSAGYQPDAIRRLVRYAEGTRPPPAAVLARRLQTLERAGPKAPAHDQVVALRSALNTAEHRARATELLSGGVFGREAEQARIAAWIAKPQHKKPACSLHVSGLPGIGKSYLLQAAVQAASAGDKGVLTVWLDFDRSGLAVTDATAFFEEVSRQMGRGEGKLKPGDAAVDFDLAYAGGKSGRVQLSKFFGKRPVALVFGSFT